MTTVAMRLAQAPWAPDGDPDDRLELRLTLDAQAHPDIAAFEADPDPWIVTRHQPGQPPRTTKLVRLDEGWALSSLRGDDEPLWPIFADLLRPGELIDLRQPDGTALVFRIVSVEGD